MAGCRNDMQNLGNNCGHLDVEMIQGCIDMLSIKYAGKKDLAIFLIDIIVFMILWDATL